MPKRRDGHVTESELRKFRKRCPQPGCTGFASETVLSRAAWRFCLVCGHEWDYRDGAGRAITREQKNELTRMRSGGRGTGEAEERRVVARRREQYRQEAQEMKKSTKAAKTAKGAGQKKTKKAAGDKKPSIAAIVRDFLTKNPKATDERVVQEFRKTHPDEKSGVRHVQHYRKQLGIASPSATKKPVKKAKATKPAKS